MVLDYIYIMQLSSGDTIIQVTVVNYPHFGWWITISLATEKLFFAKQCFCLLYEVLFRLL